MIAQLFFAWIVQVIVRKTVLTAAIVVCTVLGFCRFALAPVGGSSNTAAVACIGFTVATIDKLGFNEWPKLDGVVATWLALVLVSDNLASLSLVWHVVRL